MQKIKKILLISLALILFVGCGSNETKEQKKKRSSEQKEEHNVDNVDFEGDIFTSHYEVNEKGINKDLKSVTLEKKLIKSFNLMKNDFEYPQTGKSTKRTIYIDEDIPIEVIDFVGSELRGRWHELVPVKDYYEYKFVGYTNEEHKFEKDKIYALLIEFDPKDGYEMYTYENIEDYPELKNNRRIINRSYRLNGLPNREVRGPAEFVGEHHGIFFYFPRTK